MTNTVKPYVLMISRDDCTFHLVGPFDSIHEASDWGTQNEDRGGNNGWQTVRSDPSHRLDVRPPTPTRAANGGDPGFVVIVHEDVLTFHLVGPFDSIHEASDWGTQNEDENLHEVHWQPVRVDPSAPIDVRQPTIFWH